MKKKLIRLTESDLHRIVENSVKRIIKESQHNSFDNEFDEDDDDELDDYDEYYEPLDGNLSFDNDMDYPNSDDLDDIYDDSEYFEGRSASDRRTFEKDAESGHYNGPIDNDIKNQTSGEFYKNPQQEINKRLKRIKKGEPIEKVFRVTRKPSNDIYVIEFNYRYNFINVNDGKLLSDKWFNNVKIEYQYDDKYLVGMVDNPGHRGSKDVPLVTIPLDN